MELNNLLGSMAGTLTTIAFIPQVVKTWKTKSANDVSAGMFLIFSTGLVLWLVYGILLLAWPIIIANSVTLVLAGSILYLKYVYRNQN